MLAEKILRYTILKLTTLFRSQKAAVIITKTISCFVVTATVSKATDQWNICGQKSKPGRRRENTKLFSENKPVRILSFR